jgi:hypothetical protein
MDRAKTKPIEVDAESARLALRRAAQVLTAEDHNLLLDFVQHHEATLHELQSEKDSYQVWKTVNDFHRAEFNIRQAKHDQLEKAAKDAKARTVEDDKLVKRLLAEIEELKSQLPKKASPKPRKRTRNIEIVEAPEAPKVMAFTFPSTPRGQA